MRRYEEIASAMAEQIRSQGIPVGTRLPSIRTLMVERGVGQSTAFQVYGLLEQWGLALSRQRSGYFVTSSASNDAQASLATGSRFDDPPTGSLVFSAIEVGQRAGVAPLGLAFPSPELFPLQRLARAIRHVARLSPTASTSRNLTPGNEALRRQIAIRYAGMGVSLRLDELIITDGATEALNLCLQAATRPGDIVAIESPCHYGTIQAIARLGLKPLEIPVTIASGIDLQALAEALRWQPVRACVFMPNVHQPTGITWTAEKKQALVGLLDRYDIPLIEDDVLGELYFEGRRPLPAKAYDAGGLVMHCSSFSKSLAPGYRVGWVAAGRYTERVRRLKLSTTGPTSGPVQDAIAEYLQAGGYDRHLRGLRVSLRQQLDDMAHAIATWFPDLTTYERPSGGHSLWVELPPHHDAATVFRAAARRGISIAPGPIFSASGGYTHHVRLNFGTPWNATLAAAMESLGGMLDAESYTACIRLA
ncbi:PLP-dependent aminotransferase family protein [Cupriavidus sp. 2KB_3]|uniref:aminotransferase-like domain-containing protein n=1 Tax=Cupriavidus sp. 2KB_3 TaxID=3232980 RepID=UPI003F8FF15A